MITGGHMRKKRLTRKQRIMRKRITIAACVAVVLLLNANRKKSTDTNDNTIVTTSDSSNNTESKAGDSINSSNNSTDTASKSDASNVNSSDDKSTESQQTDDKKGSSTGDGVTKTFIPENPEVPVTEARSNKSLDKDLMTAFRKMQADATAKGLNIYIASGYRSYDYQVGLYNRYVANDGKAAADTYSSRPGNSEHQTGLCFDLNSIEDSFQYTSEGKWVNDNCYKYGFCIRFPKGKDAYTGYQYESWHLRYVGTELAEKLYNNGDWISLEEYFGITSEYPD